MNRGVCPLCSRTVPGVVVHDELDVRFVRLNKHRYVTRVEDPATGRVRLTDHGWCGDTTQRTVVPHVEDLPRFYELGREHRWQLPA